MVFRAKLLFYVLLCFAAFPLPGHAAESEGVVDDIISKVEQYQNESKPQIFILTFLAISTSISEDLACIAAGLLAAQNVVEPWAAIVACGLGIYIGNVILYFIGWFFGAAALDRAPLKWLFKEKTVTYCQNLFERRGLAIIFLSRFLPGSRTPIFLTAGIMRLDMVKLLLFFAATLVVWTPLLVFVVMYFGRQAIELLNIYSSYGLPILVALVVVCVLIVRYILPRLYAGRKR